MQEQRFLPPLSSTGGIGTRTDMIRRTPDNGTGLDPRRETLDFTDYYLSCTTVAVPARVSVGRHAAPKRSQGVFPTDGYNVLRHGIGLQHETIGDGPDAVLHAYHRNSDVPEVPYICFPTLFTRMSGECPHTATAPRASVSARYSCNGSASPSRSGRFPLTVVSCRNSARRSGSGDASERFSRTDRPPGYRTGGKPGI